MNAMMAGVAIAWTGAAATFAIGVAEGTMEMLFITLGLGTFLGIFISLTAYLGASKSPLIVELRDDSFVLKFRRKDVKIELSDIAGLSGKGIIKRDKNLIQCIWLDRAIKHEMNKALMDYREGQGASTKVNR